MPRKGNRNDEDSGDYSLAYFSRSSRFSSIGQNRTNQVFVPESAKDVRDIVEDELRLWGIGHDVHHKSFMTLAKARATKEFEGDVDIDSSMTPLDLPADQNDGVKVVLQQTLLKKTKNGSRLELTKITDNIEDIHGVHLPYPPFMKDRINGGLRLNGNGSLSLNGGYGKIEGLEERMLDPFERFCYGPVAARDNFLSQWGKWVEYDNIPALAYHIVDAAATHNMVKGGQLCCHCKSGRLKFNCSIDRRFSDVYCESCGSTYLILSKESVYTIRKMLDKKKVVTSRSFGTYQKEKSLLPANGKMFAVLVSSSESPLTAFASEIIGARPTVHFKTFNRSQIRFGSHLIINPVYRENAWFSFHVSPSLGRTSFSIETIKSFFAGLQGITVEGAEQASEEKEEEGTPQLWSDEKALRSRIRELKRKRNRIENIKKKLDNGEDTVGPDELSLVNEYDDILTELEKLEKELY